MKLFEYLHEVSLSNLVLIYLLFTRKVLITSTLASSFTNRQTASCPFANGAVDASRLGLRNVMSSGFPWLRLASTNDSRSYYKVRYLVHVWRKGSGGIYLLIVVECNLHGYFDFMGNVTGEIDFMAGFRRGFSTPPSPWFVNGNGNGLNSETCIASTGCFLMDAHP